MGHGGPLAFLNKKTWHPASLRNMEEVWKREQNAAREQKKLEELRKQIDEERQKDELHRVAEAAGVTTREEKLDWIYAGGMAAKQDAEKRAEDQMLGVKPVELPDEKVVSKCERASLLPSFYAEDTPASANETWARLHNDPLFAIKQQELTARKSIVANPVKMQQIKKEVMELQGTSKKVKEKKSKKEKKHKKEKEKEKERQKEKEKKHKRSPSPDDRNGKKHKHSDTPGEPKRHTREDDHRHKSHRTDAHGGTTKHESSHTHHTAEHRSNRKKYGLDFNGEDVPDERDRSKAAEDTRRRLEEAARKKEQEEQEKAAQRYTRRDYKPGKLSASDKAAKLAAMMDNADLHEQQRSRMVKELTQREQEELAAAGGSDTAVFLTHAAKSVYGAEGQRATLEETVGRRKFYSDRKGDTGFRR